MSLKDAIEEKCLIIFEDMYPYDDAMMELNDIIEEIQVSFPEEDSQSLAVLITDEFKYLYGIK